MKAILISFSAVFLVLTSSFAQSNDPYYLTLKEMFEVSGVEETYEAAIIQMIEMYKQQSPQTDAALWDGLQNEFLGTSIDDLVEMLVPVYQKHMTIEDLKGMIAFYTTPLGKKFVASTPAIMSESMLVGQMWGQKLGESFTKRLEERGY